MTSKHSLWESGRDERVEIDQRALIDKILARYSGEFTVFRELLQNSDDAQSDAVEIRFETEDYISQNANSNVGTIAAHRLQSVEGESLPDLKTTLVHQWTFKNNGHTFREEDWDRLKKIADGNPDEEKIGAFGVGFYSLFSVTEEPFVTSGNQWMGFYWKDNENQLFARRGQLPGPDKSPKPWTTFTIPLREPTPIPLAFDFSRFLATSLTFMRYLSEVCVYFNDKRLVKLHRAHGTPSSLGIPKGLKNSSPQGTMTVDDIQITPLVIKAQVMKWIYTSGTDKNRQVAPKPMEISSPEAMLSSVPSSQSSHALGAEKERQIVQKIPGSGKTLSSLLSSLSGSSTPRNTSAPLPPTTNNIHHPIISERSVSLSIYSASIRVRLDKKMSSEIQRSTKKDPPAKMKFELIYTAKDEYDANLEEEATQPVATGSIFQGLMADVDGLGTARVFIGHSTAQSTGIGGHIAARFIPTVERESIDLMNPYVAVWNKELLYIGGLLSRAIYEFELSAMQELWASNAKSSAVDPTESERITNKALHTLKFFGFYPSTPSSDVSSLMKSAFFNCSTHGRRFPVISNHGVCLAANIRLPDPMLSFLKDISILPDCVVASVPLMVATLKNRSMIRQIDFRDIFLALKSQPLTQDEFVACVNWWTTIVRKENVDLRRSMRTELINSIKLTYENDQKIQRVIPLSSIKTFLNPSSPCKDIPSDSPLPDHLLPLSFSKLLKPETLSHAFPWTELNIVQWISYICELDQPEYNLNMSPHWAERVIALIGQMWTNLPAQSTLEIIRLLQLRSCIPTSCGMFRPQDAYFPSVNILSDLPVVTFTSDLVIKGSVDKFLQDLGVRKHVELQVIFDRMINTNKWTVADLTKYLVSVRESLTLEELQQLGKTAAFPKEGSGDSIEAGERFTLNQLYEPLEVFRALKLPVIDWGAQLEWTSSSEEAILLFILGLQRQPPLPTLIELCAGDDPKIRSAALQYLLDNMGTRYRDYDPSNFPDVKFIPALKGSEPCLGTIQEVFSAPWAAVGFLILQPPYQPYAAQMKIQDQPSVSKLMSILRETPPGTEAEAKYFSPTDLCALSTTAFVPTKPENCSAGATMEWKTPSQCFLTDEVADVESESFYSKLFSFVDFGAVANAFLQVCGARTEPSVEDVAKILLASPRTFYDLSGGHNNFLSELRKLAENYTQISPSTLSKMKDSPILLGLQRKRKRQEKKTDVCENDRWNIIHELKKPDEIIVVDDRVAYQSFSDSIFAAPREDAIEAFYCHLGSMKFTDLIDEAYERADELCDSKIASDVRALILERLPLFLNDQIHGRTGITFSWLSANQNFIVKAFRQLIVVKELTYGDLRISRTDHSSAVAYYDSQSGHVGMWIAGNVEIDMYDVAKSLNHLLFHSPTAHDTLLFTTILSTDLQSLARRGYDVDRIHRQQEIARLAPESKRVAEEENDHEEESNQKEKLARIVPQATRAAPMPNVPITPKATAHDQQTKLSNVTSESSTTNTTAWNDITKNIDLAVTSGRVTLLANQQLIIQQAKECVNGAYCDISGRKAQDLCRIGQIESVSIHLSKEMPIQAEAFMAKKSQSLSRFRDILNGLANIYNLSLANFHIFYDIEGEVIAFNQRSSIFINLRYFEAWHKSDVENGKLQQAYIWWYFTIAHQFAHNLEPHHNVAHEFYFTAISEQYMIQLIHQLKAPSGGQFGRRK